MNNNCEFKTCTICNKQFENTCINCSHSSFYDSNFQASQQDNTYYFSEIVLEISSNKVNISPQSIRKHVNEENSIYRNELLRAQVQQNQLDSKPAQIPKDEHLRHTIPHNNISKKTSYCWKGLCNNDFEFGENNNEPSLSEIVPPQSTDSNNEESYNTIMLTAYLDSKDNSNLFN
jgi:hypothetical protein